MKNKKILKIITVTILLLVCTVFTSFAQETSNSKFTKENIIKLAEKYGIEVEMINSNQKLEKTFDGTYDELETLLSKAVKDPNKKIKIKDIYKQIEINSLELEKEKLEINLSLSRSTKASQGVATLSELVDIYDDLVLKCSVSGEYKHLGSTYLWEKVTSSSVSEKSNSVYSEVDSFDKNKATVEDKGKYIKQEYEITVQKYITIPLPGKIDEYLRLKVGKDEVEGNVWFYAKKIDD